MRLTQAGSLAFMDQGEAFRALLLILFATGEFAGHKKSFRPTWGR